MNQGRKTLPRLPGRATALLRALALAVGMALAVGQAAAQLPAEDGLLVQLRGSDMDGQPFDIGAARGKPVLIAIWASWCPICLAELPLLDAYYRRQAPGKFTFVALSLDREPSRIRHYLAGSPLSFPVLWRADPNTNDNLQKEVVTPVFYLVGEDGRVIWRKVGPIAQRLD